MARPLVFWHSDGRPFRNVATRFSLYGRQLVAAGVKKGGEFRHFRFHDSGTGSRSITSK